MALPKISLAGIEANVAFQNIKKLVIERTGHFYYADKDEILLDRLLRRLRALRLTSLDSYSQLLADEGGAEWGALQAEITVGETFFFRYAEQFAALRATILPRVIQTNAASRRLRIWSAGCSTGPEPYSIAIVLHELLGDRLPDWHVSIIGSDINPAALDAARAARYGDWALRGMPADDRERYFVPAGRGLWTLRPAYRAMVRFQPQNLVAFLDAPPIEFADFDLIFCRNVLIYFHPDLAVRAATSLGRCLSPDGWLFLGHAEAGLVGAADLHPVPLAGTSVYRRREGTPVELPEAPPSVSLAPASVPLIDAALASLPPAPRFVEPPAPLPSAGRGESKTRLDDLAHLADAGEMERAMAACAVPEPDEMLAPRLHFYEGLLKYAQRDLRAAETAFRRAVYLDKKHVLSHYFLGLTFADERNGRAASTFLRNAIHLAESRPEAEVLADGDGMTVGAMRSLARYRLQHLREGAA